MLVLILGIIIFLGIHSVRIVAPQFREAQILQRGEGGWKGIYSIVSLVGLVLIIWGYSLARPDAAFIYEPPTWMKHINALFMLLAFISMMVANLPAGRLKPILKHPFLLPRGQHPRTLARCLLDCRLKHDQHRLDDRCAILRQPRNRRAHHRLELPLEIQVPQG